VTCFQKNSCLLDEQAQEKLIDYVLREQQVDGVVACATTGEFAALSDDEYQKTCAFILKRTREIKKDAIVMAGTTSMDPKITLARNHWAYEHGFDGVLTSYPPYVKPDQRGMLNYFETLAQATPKLPIFLYNIWYRTGGQGMNAQTIIQLAKIPNVYGIKDCGVGLEHLDEVIANTSRDEFLYLTGEDSLLFEALTHGGDGAIFASAHLLGKEMKQMMHCMQQKKLSAALAIHRKIKPLIQALFAEPNPAPLKFALNEIGINVGDPCGPAILAITEKTKALIKEAMAVALI
jgi:4-hydroxy-tetrahydrodipicolinate synthase